MTVDAPLVEGRGRCALETYLQFKPTKHALEVGAGMDLVRTILVLVHARNRRSDRDDFLAIGLPGLDAANASAGADIVVHGSRASVAAFLASDGVERLFRRRLCERPVPGATKSLDTARGVAFVRDRTCDKTSEAWRRRNERRAERRGKALGAVQPPERERTGVVAISYGKATLGIRALEDASSCLLDTVDVSTYGFSSPSSPSFLPRV